MRNVYNQALFDLRMWLRNGEQALLNIVLPLASLLLLNNQPTSAETKTTVIVIGTTLTSSFTATAIATAFDRRAGVLKAYSVMPLGKQGFVAARALTAIMITSFQLVALTITGHVFTSWFRPSVLEMALALLCATTWIAWALMLASLLRAEAVLAVSNVVLLTLFMGFSPFFLKGYETLSSILLALPTNAAVLASQSSLASFGVLCVWCITGLLLAVRTFRWE
jgi:ABC-2 type transport system permease protein